MDLFAQRHGIFVLGSRCIQRIGHAILLALAEVIDQQVSRDSGYPSHECPAFDIVGLKGTIHFNENFLGEILSIVARAGKAVADVVNAPVVALHDLLPRRGVARKTAAYQHGGDLRVFQSLAPLELPASQVEANPAFTRPCASTLTLPDRYVFMIPKVLAFDETRHCNSAVK